MMPGWITAGPGRWVAATLAALALLAGCATLDEQQRRLIFQPTDRSWWGGTAAAEGMHDVWIEFSSRVSGEPVRLHGLWLPQPRAGAPVLLYLHGARWDVRGSAFRMRRMHDLGFAVLGVDYRGFGQSSKVLPSEAMAYEDARAAWDWLAARLGERAPRFIFGHSLGGAIAVNLAHEVSDAAGLIVEGSFTSIADVAGSMRWGWLPISPFITQRFDSASKIKRVRIPVLVVHGGEDRLIKPELGRALFERAREPKRFVLVEGASHHNANALGQPLYREALAELWPMLAAPQVASSPPEGEANGERGQPSIAQRTGLAPSASTSAAGAMPTK
jgi:hypothetical protein